MLVLMLFAVIAGAGTAVTPCVLPVLPALLSASAAGGRRRPFGIILGLAITFTISIIALAQITRGVGLASGATRTLAVIVLIAFGIVMLFPPLAERVQAPLSRLARFGPKTRGSGFWTGLGVGAALGFVCAPCAGPILAAVISVSASGNTSARVVAVGISYTVGLSAVLTVYSIGGRKLMDVVRRRARGHIVEQTLGAVLLITALLIATNLDVKFENALAKGTSGASHSSFLAFLVDPTHGLEDSHAVESRLNSLRPASRFVLRADAAAKLAAKTPPKPKVVPVDISIPGVKTPALSDLGPAPNFTDTQDWFNTPGDKPLSITELHGKVVLIDFWTFTCINCIRTLPDIEGLYKTYHKYGLEVVGVETPEFTFEQDASTLDQAVKNDGLTYPVVQDNRYGTWDAYQNEYWPADYLIDAKGDVEFTNFGEGNYGKEEAAVRQLLYNAGDRTLPPPMTAHAIMPSTNIESEETYLNPKQYNQYQQSWAAPIASGTHTYTKTVGLAPNSWELGGTWTASSQADSSIAPAGSEASITGGFQAAHVYLVMSSAGNTPRTGRVLLDGKPLPAADDGADVKPGGTFTVTGARLYSLLSFPTDRLGSITVQLPPGISAFDFTFG
jgi:cytochrome c biogenesis protein CcdA/thiol-disulfide isomerase/thioredoxin